MTSGSASTVRGLLVAALVVMTLHLGVSLARALSVAPAGPATIAPPAGAPESSLWLQRG